MPNQKEHTERMNVLKSATFENRKFALNRYFRINRIDETESAKKQIGTL